jgi:hypothetical protein
MIDEFGHGLILEGARYVFVGHPFSAIPLFIAQTHAFSLLCIFFILAATLIILLSTTVLFYSTGVEL